MKFIYRILAFSLALLLLAASLVGCAGRKRPLNYLKSSLTRTLEKSDVGEILALLVDAFEKGSVGLSFGGGAEAPISAGSVQLYFDERDGRVMADTALTMAGKNYDAKIWLTEHELIASSTAFLGSTTLGVDLTTLEADLKNSIFRSNSGTVFATPTVGDHTDDAVLALVEGFFSIYRSNGEIAELLDKRVEAFLKDLTDYASISRYVKKGTVYIRLQVDNSMFSRALRDAWADAVKDKAFCARLRELAKTRDAMSSALGGVQVDTLAARVENWIVNDAEIEALCAKIDNATPFQFTLSAAVRRLTAGLLSLDVNYTAGDFVRGASIDLTEKDEAILTLTKNEVTHKLCWETEKDGWRTYKAAFTYQKNDSEAVTSGTLEVNRRKEDFTLTLAGDTARVMRGKIALKRKSFSLAVDSVTVGESKLDFKLSLDIRAKDEQPALPDYVSLATITEPRFTPVYNRAREAYDDFLTAWEASGVTPDARGITAYILSLADINI